MHDVDVCICGQVVVQLAVDKSRHICSAVAKGDIDVAIIGGHVPEELQDCLRVCSCLTLASAKTTPCISCLCTPCCPYAAADRSDAIGWLLISIDQDDKNLHVECVMRPITAVLCSTALQDCTACRLYHMHKMSLSCWCQEGMSLLSGAASINASCTT